MIVSGRRVVLPEGIGPAVIHVREGRIAAIERNTAASAGSHVIDAGDCFVLPGFVDTHVHINEPGRTEWEGFETATRAAAAAGITTLVDMPLNSVPPTTTVAGLDAKREAAKGRCHVDVAFWGGVVPGNAEQLEPLARSGVRGFKCFMSPSGVDEFAHVGEAELREAMPVLARLGLPLLVHAESPAALREPSGDPWRYRTWLESRPPAAEVAAIELLLDLAREYGTRVHVVHLATAAAVPQLRRAKHAGVAVTVETCPHYLTFAAEEIGDGETLFKCAPPIRDVSEREQLWAALLAGDIDVVATDHSPAPAALKHVSDGDFVRAWGGIASLQVGTAAVWAMARRRGASPQVLARWLAAAPAQLAGLQSSKGALVAGADADLVFWDADAETVVDAETLYHRHRITPYHGRRLRGRAQMTMLRGAIVFSDGACRGTATGRLV
jgi:allantoinase